MDIECVKEEVVVEEVVGVVEVGEGEEEEEVKMGE